MDQHLRLARRLHNGARRRGRSRSGPFLCRERVRYVPSVQCAPFPPPRLPRPVRRDPLRPARVGPVGPTVRLAPARRRAPPAARAHRRARSAEHRHPLAPTTSTESTFHAPLLPGAAGRARRSASRSHTAAFTRLPRRPGWLDPGLHLLHRRDLRHRRTLRRRASTVGPAPGPATTLATGPPQAATGFQSPPRAPPRATSTQASRSCPLRLRYDDDISKICGSEVGPSS
jgi:hypothetical protein